MVKNGMSYHTYTFPNPTNPFFFGSGERSGTKALYAKNGRNRLKGNKNHIFLHISFPSEVCILQDISKSYLFDSCIRGRKC